MDLGSAAILDLNSPSVERGGATSRKMRQTLEDSLQTSFAGPARAAYSTAAFDPAYIGKRASSAQCDAPRARRVKIYRFGEGSSGGPTETFRGKGPIERRPRGSHDSRPCAL